MAPTKTIETLTLEAAQAAAHACATHSKTINVPMNIAIVDASTHLLHFSRMDGAKLTSISIAIDKAFTAAGHRVPTSTYKEAVWPGGAAFGIWNTNGGSTGTPSQDEEVARAGVEAVERLLRGEGGRERAKL